MKVYLAGPMRGYAEFNFAAFFNAANWLRGLGHTVFNPAEHDLETCPTLMKEPGFADGDPADCPSFSPAHAFLWDFSRILESDALVLLPEWEASVGACTERFVAEMTGKRILLVIAGDEGWALYPDGQQVRMLGPKVRP